MSTYTLEGLTAVSSGSCPGCQECSDLYGFDSLEAFDAARESGKLCDEPHFSWSPCGVCGSHLGGDREAWHAIAGNDGDDLHGRDILHFDNMCTDCVCFIANGNEPENWEV